MRIIFHHPLPLDPLAKSASGIRPLKMLKAFQTLGCQVDVISGYASERKRAIAIIKKNIRQGVKYALMYAESATQPTTLTDKHHLPLHPWMDGEFFHFCKRHDIPIGLFYRDIYWRFDEYGKNLHPLKIAGAKIAYWFDLIIYKHTLSKLYLPSIEMGKYIPILNKNTFEALPPGHHQPLLDKNTSEKLDYPDFLRIFYVGGISNHYKMHVLFEAIKMLPKVELTVCTRQSEWESIKNEYPILTNNIKIIHESGSNMEERLRKCDVASIFVEAQEYREFAAPVKLYEYLGFEKPIIASLGTLAGSFVDANKIGWVVNYDIDAVTNLLLQLLQDKSKIIDMQKSVTTIATQHTWQARAQQVIQGLRHT